MIVNRVEILPKIPGIMYNYHFAEEPEYIFARTTKLFHIVLRNKRTSLSSRFD